MPRVSEMLMKEVQDTTPELYSRILEKIRPHSLSSVLRLLEEHLRSVDIEIFNTYRGNIPDFIWSFIQHMRIPVPGDPFGIYLTCRITKSDTQGTLDSKHLKSVLDDEETNFNVDKSILDALNLFSTQIQVFEIANRHIYTTAFLTDITVQELLQTIPETGYLERGGPFNMGKDAQGQYKYLSTFQFIVVEDKGSLKILYKSSRDLNTLLKYISIRNIVAFSDVRYLFRKTNIVCYFFNMLEIVSRQMWSKNKTVYEKDMTTIMKFQCRSGVPLPLTRDGLAKNPDRTPLEVLSFEAPKKNYARLSTGSVRQKWYPVDTSADKIFFGQQFNEGTGYSFAVLPQQ